MATHRNPEVTFIWLPIGFYKVSKNVWNV